MLKKLRVISEDKSGVPSPLVIGVTLSLLLIFCGVSEYFRLQIIATGTRDAVEDAIISTVNDNHAGVYRGTREGYSGGYMPYGEEEWEETLDEGGIYARIDEVLGTRKSDGRHVKFTRDNGNVAEFALTDLDMTLRNVPFALPDPGNAQRSEAEAAIRLGVPARLGRKLLPSMRVTLRVQVGYIEIF